MSPAINAMRTVPDARLDRGADPSDPSRTIQVVFADAAAGYAAVGQLRARGFRIDLAASIEGDLVVSIEAERPRADEVHGLIEAHDGRIQDAFGGPSGFDGSPRTLTGSDATASMTVVGERW